MKFCPECGVKLVGDAPKFCGECGYKLAIVGAMPTDRPNSELSDEELRAKADAGDAEAIKDVGLRFERAGDNEMARQWYERAADVGHGGAMRNLGVLRKDVDDHEGALAWFIRAADSGSDLTMDRGSITVSRPVTVSARAASQAALELFKMNRLDEAEQWIKRSQDMDDDQAVVVIAGHLHDEDFTSVRALEWCKRASDEGDVRGTIFVIAILSQTERYIEMAPYLERTLETNPEFTEVTQESFALFARMAGLQFGVEGDFPASRSWLERSEQLGDPEAAGYLATLASEEAEESTDELRLAELAESSFYKVRQAVASNPVVKALGQEAKQSTDEARLSELAQMSLPTVRKEVAGNLGTPMEVLTRLAGDLDEGVRWRVAENPSAPVEVLTRLASDQDSDVHRFVARNPSTPVEMLTQLADDPQAIVRAGVLANPACPNEVREAFGREGVARDIYTPVQALVELATSDPFSWIRRLALLNPACPQEVCEASGLVFLFTIWKNSNSGDTPTWSLSDNALGPDLIATENLPTSGGARDWEILELTLGEPDYYGDGGYQERDEVVTWVGRHAPDWWSDWSLLADVLGEDVVAALDRRDGRLFDEAMGQPGDVEGDEAVEDMAIDVAYRHREETQQDWAKVLDDIKAVVSDSREAVEDVADRLAAQEQSYPSFFVEGALARNPCSPAGVLERFAVSEDAALRWLVTRNPGASDEVKALAALSLSADERFEANVPSGDMMIRFNGFSLGVRARVWTVNECPFTDDLPYDSRTSEFGWGNDDVTIDEVTWDLFSGTASGGVVVEFDSEFVDPDDDE